MQARRPAPTPVKTPRPVEGQRHATIVIAFDHHCGKIVGTIERQHVADAQPPRVAGQRMPGAIGPRLIERDADACLAAPGGKLRRNDLGVVGNQDVARHQQPRKIPNRAVG